VVHLGSLDFVLPEALGLGGALGAGPLDADPRLVKDGGIIPKLQK